MSKVKLENRKIELQVNLKGGFYIDLRLKGNPLNPLNWRNNGNDGLSFEGHFLCCDRWGPPSDAEAANGFTHHGEASSETWKLLPETEPKDGLTHCSMHCTLPMGGLQLTRDIKLSPEQPVFFVTEKIKNLNKQGRMYNIVQHVSIAPPFLDRSTLFDTNAEKGFEDKEDGSLNQEEPVFYWPNAVKGDQTVNLRQFNNVWPRVSSFSFSENDEYAWVTACNPGKNLMLGYVWKTADYPWINFWRSMEDDVPMAFGMEFGTTGLHEPMPIVAKKGKIFGRNIYDFLDSQEVVRKSFTAFLAKIPEDYQGVSEIEIGASAMIIKEKNNISRDINYRLMNF